MTARDQPKVYTGEPQATPPVTEGTHLCDASAAWLELAGAYRQLGTAEAGIAHLERRVAYLEGRTEKAEAAIARVRELIDSYPPGSRFVTSGLADLFRAALDRPADGEQLSTPATEEGNPHG